ncbi:MAG: putative MFS family arabinose efflux permease [Nitriliruptoraceae bacterium]
MRTTSTDASGDAASDPTVTAPRLVPLSIVKLVGNGLFRFIYPFLGVVAVDVGLGEGAEGLLITALAVGGMVTPMVARWLVGDGEAPRRQATAGLVLLAVATVLLGIVAPPLLSAARPAAIAVGLLAAAVLGTAKPLLDVGAMAYVSPRVPFAARGRALSILELTWAGGLLVLAPLGALAGATSWRVSLLVLGAASLAGVPLLRRWLVDDATTNALEVASRTDAGGAHTPATPTMAGSGWRFLLAIVLIFIALEMTFGVVGLWLTEDFGATLATIGLFTSVGAVGELTGSVLTVALSDRLGKARMAGIGMALCAAGFAVLGVADTTPLALGGLAIGLMGTETAIVAAIALASEVDPVRRSRFLNRMVAASSVSRALGGAAGPLVLRRSGIGLNTSISVVAAVAAVVVLAHVARRDPRLGE